MPIARVNGYRMNFRQAGQGEDLILIHGLAANHAFWNLVLLLPLAREYRVTVCDLRGHGYSDMPLSGYTSANMATDVFALMDHLEIERAHLVGHSFGGVVALHGAVTCPQRVASLTLADSRVRALQPHQRLRDWPNWRQAQDDLRELGISIDENAENVGLCLLEKLASPEWRATRKGLAKKGLFLPFGGWSAGNRSAARWLNLLRTTTARQDIVSLAGLTRARVSQVRQPTLAIYGEHSRCLKTCEVLQRILPDCRTVVVPGVGHFYPVIKPAFVAEQLLEFLRRVSSEGHTAGRALTEGSMVPPGPARGAGTAAVSARTGAAGNAVRCADYARTSSPPRWRNDVPEDG